MRGRFQLDLLLWGPYVFHGDKTNPTPTLIYGGHIADDDMDALPTAAHKRGQVRIGVMHPEGILSHQALPTALSPRQINTFLRKAQRSQKNHPPQSHTYLKKNAHQLSILSPVFSTAQWTFITRFLSPVQRHISVYALMDVEDFPESDIKKKPHKGMDLPTFLGDVALAHRIQQHGYTSQAGTLVKLFECGGTLEKLGRFVKRRSIPLLQGLCAGGLLMLGKIGWNIYHVPPYAAAELPGLQQEINTMRAAIAHAKKQHQQKKDIQAKKTALIPRLKAIAKCDALMPWDAILRIDADAKEQDAIQLITASPGDGEPWRRCVNRALSREKKGAHE